MVTGVQHEALGAHVAKLEQRVEVLAAQADEDSATRTAILARAVPAQELAEQLRTSTHTVPVKVPPVLAEDPAFAGAGSLVGAVDVAYR